MQQIVALALVGFAAGYLLVRWVRRRGAGNCCGETECPAAKQTLRKLRDVR